MTTSLAQQLKKLALPESSGFTHTTKKVSLLFDPKEAASIDRETFFEIGLSGLSELKNINPSFAVFENNLFNVSSKDFERSVQTKDANERLDKTIKSFLLRLSPYFLLQPAHKALEWLINRFQIHKYNKDDIFTLILPYHETKIFIRFLQIIKISSSNDFWSWLLPLRKPGIPMAKNFLYNHCISNVAFLRFISDMTKRTVEEFGEKADTLTTLYAFYCSTIVGALENVTKVTEGFLTSILPGIMDCLSSPLSDLRAAGYIITAQLLVKTQLNEKVAKHFVNKIILFNVDLHYEAVLLLHIIYETQENIHSFSEKSLANFTPNHMKMFCNNLVLLIDSGIDITKLLIAFLKGVLTLIQRDGEYLRLFSKLPEILISDLKISSYSAEKLIKCVLDSYSPNPNSKAKEVDSDVEMIDSDNDDSFSADIQMWYTQFLKSIEEKYPVEFDKVLKNEIKTNKDISDTKLSSFHIILGFAPKIIKKVGDSFLFEKLYHSNADMRIEAVKFLISDYKKMLKSNKNFLTESIIDRLVDDEPEVVLAVLSLSHNLTHLLTKDIFINHLKKIAIKGQLDPNWWKPACAAVDILCSFAIENLDKHAYFSILPYLFPNNEEAYAITLKILKSPVSKILSEEDLFEIINIKGHKNICKAMYKHLSNNEFLPRTSEIIEIMNHIDTNDYVSILFSLIVMSLNLNEEICHDESLIILNNVLRVVKKFELTSVENTTSLSSNAILNFINAAKNTKLLPIESLLFFFDKLISHTSIHDAEDWIDFCNRNSQKIFIINVFETALDNHFKKYKHFSGSLLNKLTNKFCKDTAKKIEFIGNMVIGYACAFDKDKNQDDKDILLIRSTRILQALIHKSEDISWVLNSDILIVSILVSLNSPEIHMRKMAFNIIEILSKRIEASNDHYLIFLKELLSRHEEILIDNDQLPLIIYTLLSPDTSVKKVLKKSLHAPMKETLKSYLNIILMDKTPYYVKETLLNLLTCVNSRDILTSLSSLGLDILSSFENELDVHQSKTLINIISRINSSNLTVKNETVWNFIEKTLINFKLKSIDENNIEQFVCTIMLQQIDQDVFESLPLDKAQNVLKLILNAGTFGTNPAIVSTAFKTVKKIEIASNQFLSVLNKMENICNKNADNLMKKKITAPSLSLLDTEDWKIGVTLLEYIQDKKKLSGFEDILPRLFNILKICLDFEEQSVVEYVKQLLLTSILHCCQKICPINEVNAKNTSKCVVDIELIITCIRGTQNPQTHHHALMLLSHVAYMFPDQVLQYMMAIFTFIGSSVLRQDDAYSFQIITKIIETIIPILVKCDCSKDLNEEQISKMQLRIVPVLRIFVDAILDIPEHRRLPLFKKLLQTLNADHFAWTFLSLVFESHVVHSHQEKNNTDGLRKNLADKEQPARLEIAMALINEFPADTIIQSCNKLIYYMKTLPEDKIDDESSQPINPAEIFSVPHHSAKQLRHFKYVTVTFVNNVLSSSTLIQNMNKMENKFELEQIYKSFIVNILTYIQTVSKIADRSIGKPQAKYWKVLLHYCFEVLDNVNNLLSPEMFTTVIRGLMNHNLMAVQRKAMEILNSKMQYPGFFVNCEKSLMFSLMDPLLSIIEQIDNSQDDVPNKQELELNQQTALLSMKLLVRLLCKENPSEFKNILNIISDLTKSSSLPGNLMASVVLCLAELCSNLKANAISSLPKFMPSLIKIIKTHTKASPSELVVLSVITAVYKIIETIPLFLSPYLEKLLYHLSILSAIWDKDDKSSPIKTKLTMIKSKISNTIAPRVLIPVISQCYNDILKKGAYEAIGPVMNILADSFTGVSGPEFTSLQQDLTNLFLLALQFRSDHIESDDISSAQIDQVENHIINALVALILKLSESSFRPLYFKIYDWSVRNSNDNKERAITFYRLSSQIAENLKGLFILFAGHFIKNAADLLNSCNINKSKELYFESEEKCCVLVEYILKTLNSVFMYDTQNFVNKERFETIMQPLVDQLDNTIGGMDTLTLRANNVIIPCISQFAIATADDSLWKPLNYQILLKTRHNDSNIRLLGLKSICEMATKLGDSWLPLLPESVPFLAELLEDDIPTVESATQKSIQTLESVLGEPLQKYF